MKDQFIQPKNISMHTEVVEVDVDVAVKTFFNYFAATLQTHPK